MSRDSRQPGALLTGVIMTLDQRMVIGMLVCLILCGLLFNPYVFAVSDHTYKIPFLKAFFHSNLYVRDITVGMKDYYTTFFYILVWPLEKLLGFQLAFFLLFILTNSMFYTSVYLLGATLFKEKAVGLFSVAFLLVSKGVLGGIFTIDSIVEERMISAVIMLFGIYLLLSRRFIWSAVFFAVSANLHFVTFINHFIFLAVAFLINYVFCRERGAMIKRYAPFFVVLFLGCLPIVIKGFLLSSHKDGFVFVDPAWLKMILIRSSHHFWPQDKIFFNFMWEAAGVLFVVFAFRMYRAKEVRQGMILFVSAIVAMVVGFMLGSVFVKVYPVLLGIQLCFFRASYIFVVFFYIVCSWILYMLLQYVITRWRIPYGRIIVLSVVFLIAGATLVKEHHTKIIRYDPFKQNSNADIEAQLWLKNNTPEDALILTPPYIEDFRIFSERATLGSWKDWTYNCLSRKFAFTMYERLQDIGGISLDSKKNNFASMRAYYLNLKKDTLLPIARKYGIDYVVMEKENPLDLEKMYENRRYAIYKF